MTTVYEVGYARELNDDVTDVKFVGVFSTREKADEAFMTVRSLLPYSRFPDCLYVMDVEVDIDHWTYGFFTPEE